MDNVPSSSGSLENEKRVDEKREQRGEADEHYSHLLIEAPEVDETDEAALLELALRGLELEVNNEMKGYTA